MSGPAIDAFDPGVGDSGLHRDAVVAGSDCGLGDGDAGWRLNMDAVGVGAAAGCTDLQISQRDALAVLYRHVDELAVQWGQPTDQYILRLIENERLHKYKKKKTLI